MRLNKINEMRDGRVLMMYFANNRGRGSDNCTLVVAPTGTARPTYSRGLTGYPTVRTSAWAGNVNLSRRVCSQIGIKIEDIVHA